MNATTASRVSNHLRRRGLHRAGSAAIYSVVLDGETALCLTEPQLDTWWRSLSPEDKAEIYEQHLGDGVERCNYCGCTEQRACLTDGHPCAWLDPNHTVCSAPACSTRYHAEMFDQVFHGGPQKVVTARFNPAERDELLNHFESNRASGVMARLEEPPYALTREQIDHFLRTGEWLTLGEYNAAVAAQQQEVPHAAV